MNNFRKPNRNKKPNTLDGFISSNDPIESSEDDIRKRFQKSYRPNKNDSTDNKSTNIDRVRSNKEGFHSRNSKVEEKFTTLRDSSNFDLNLDEEEPKKGWFRRKNKKRSLRRRIFRRLAVSFLALLIAVGSLFTYGYIKTNQIFKGDGEGAAALQENVDPSRLNGEGDGRINILLLGKGGPGHEAPDLTDTILLASIDPVGNEAALLSIPRDLYVQDVNGYSTKINAVYSNAKQARLASGDGSGNDEEVAEVEGLKAIKNVVNEVLGVPIHYYTMVNFKAFEDAIDTVGGVTIDVEEALVDWTIAHKLGGNPIIAEEGLQTFDGERALYYARSRKGSARGDFDRTERQREIIVALQNKILSAGTYANPLKVVELLNAFGNNVRTDLNGIEEVRRLYEIGSNIGPDRVLSIELTGDPLLVTTDNINGLSIVSPVEGLYQYDDIQDFVRNTLRDSYLKDEDARVVILNGTSKAGLATAKETELKSYGYNVVLVDNAPTASYENTKLLDLTFGQKRYTKSYLEKRLGISSTNLSTPGLPTLETADFVIILGNDEVIKTTQD